ncbi:hypothetical protein DIPPA_65113, partial [Diplonema papillatum]
MWLLLLYSGVGLIPLGADPYVISGSFLQARFEDFRAGGLSLTVSLLYDSWALSEEDKAYLIDSMTSSYPAPGGWDDRKPHVLDPSLVAVVNRNLVIGDLRPDPGYQLQDMAYEIQIVLRSSMFASGYLPLGGNPVLVVNIDADCAQPLVYGFDNASIALPSTDLKYSTFAVKDGAASLQLTGRSSDVLYSIPIGGKPQDLSYWGRIDGYAPLIIGVRGNNGNTVEFRMSHKGFEAAIVPGSVYKSSWMPRIWRWYFVEWEFDWVLNEVTFYAAAEKIVTVSIPFSTVDSLVIRSELSIISYRVSYVDLLRVGCHFHSPVFTVSQSPPVVTLFQGSGAKPSLQSGIAVVQGDSTNCSLACNSTLGCSEDAGALVNSRWGVEWREGDFSGLSTGNEYRVCYRGQQDEDWILLEGSFLAGWPATSSPSFAPVTSAPTTPAPPTTAPPTRAPPTRAPPTGVPPTPAPSTVAPLTKAPTTTAPYTSAPLTVAPLTKSPPTAAPSTPAPRTAAPHTAAPPTTAPPTKAPPTA